MSAKWIYLDYAATTPVDPDVAEKIAACLTLDGDFANPASRQHVYGRRAHDLAEEARKQVADLIGAEPAEIIWTSGATESNNLALKGVSEAYTDRGRHIISMKTEHKSVVDTLRHLEGRGWRVSWLEPDQDGRLSIDALRSAITEETVLLSLMLVNNETGVIQDVEAIAALAREHGVLLHVDAAQAAGKLAIDVDAMQIDLLSMSAHKAYGPKGVGALYVRRRPRVRVVEQMHGGGHERGMRSGTLPVHQIVGFGAACEIAQAGLEEESARIAGLRDRVWEGLSALPETYRNGSADHVVSGILNVSFAGVDGEALHAGLAGLGLAISSGSACTAASQEASYVLRALGRDDELAYASVRFSLGRWTSLEEVDATVCKVTSLVKALRASNPQWPETSTQAALSLADHHPDYSDEVWRYFKEALEHASTGQLLAVQARTPGSRALLALDAVMGDGKVTQLKTAAYGCVSALAVSAWLRHRLEGGELGRVSAEEIIEALNLAPVKRHCALLAEDAVAMLIEKNGQNLEAPSLAAS